MPKKKASQQKKSAIKIVRHKYRVLIAAGLLLSLSLISVVLAQWGSLHPMAKLNASIVAPAPTVTPNSLAPNNPVKEYIYAGGKLIATEEATPAPTATPTPSPSPSTSPTPSPTSTSTPTPSSSPTPTPAQNGATFISQSVQTATV